MPEGMEHFAVWVLSGFKSEAWGTVQLADNHPFGTVDEQLPRGSLTELAHEDFLFLDASFLSWR